VTISHFSFFRLKNHPYLAGALIGETDFILFLNSRSIIDSFSFTISRIFCQNEQKYILQFLSQCLAVSRIHPVLDLFSLTKNSNASFPKFFFCLNGMNTNDSK